MGKVPDQWVLARMRVMVFETILRKGTDAGDLPSTVAHTMMKMFGDSSSLFHVAMSEIRLLDAVRMI